MKMEYCVMPTKAVKKLEKFLHDKDAEKIEWIDADEARKILGRGGKELKKTTFSSYVSRGIIPPSCYKTAVNGKKLFNKKKLLGFE